MVARQQFKMAQMKKEYGGKNQFIMSIIDLNDGKTSLEKEYEQIRHGTEMAHECGQSGHDHKTLNKLKDEFK